MGVIGNRVIEVYTVFLVGHSCISLVSYAYLCKIKVTVILDARYRSLTDYINKMSDLGDWFKGIPFFTRWWLALTLGFTLCGRFGIFKGHQLVLLYEPFIKQFQVRYFVDI